MRWGMATKARYKRRNFQNKAGMTLATVVVIILATVVSIKSVSLFERVNELEAKEASIKAQIDVETKRKAEIEEYERYTQTQKYREDIARDKLGLVYPGEIIFKNEAR